MQKMFFACDRVGNFELLLPNTNLISPPGGAILVSENGRKCYFYTLTTDIAPPGGEIEKGRGKYTGNFPGNSV